MSLSGEPAPPRARLRTYRHLEAERRIPDAYDIATTRLLYHPGRGTEVALPFSDWYARHGAHVAFPGVAWERFHDPERTTYADYVARMAERETVVKHLFDRMESGAEPLSEAALKRFVASVAPLRFVLHGMQMVAAYLGQLAPEGRVTIVCAFEAANQLRRIQHIAYRMGLLFAAEARLDDSRARFTGAAEWQPLRGLVERLLVTWDFGAAFAGLFGALKPALDDFTCGPLAEALRASGDYLFAEVLASHRADVQFSRGWTAALTALIADRPANAAELERLAAPRRTEAAHATLALTAGLQP
jgi:toluene monooxygenase system protein E